MLTHHIPARGRKQKPFSHTHVFNDASYPREGTETSATRSSRPPAWTHHIPARGRKLGGLALMYDCCQDASYPREGTETGWPCALKPTCRDASYPREGTETCPCPQHTNPRNDASYPREGTETGGLFVDIVVHDRRIISPRGDGNMAVDEYTAPPHDASYPREGTEAYAQVPGFGARPDVSHPPRGDGNSIRFSAAITSERTHRIPVRGRKRVVERGLCLEQVAGRIISPRGDGNYSLKPLGYYPITSPARGRKHAVPLVTLVKAGRMISQRGDGNLKC